MVAKKILILLFFCFHFNLLFACKWCEDWQIGPYLGRKIKLETKNKALKEELEKNLFKKEDSGLAGKNFYNEYLLKYYPRAAVASDYFYEMCPVAINVVLSEVVDILSKNEWFYYQNRPKGFKSGEYWEITLEQCFCYSKFLTESMVDEKGNIVAKDGSFFFFYSDEQGKKEGLLVPLLDYFNFHGMMSHFYFYAEYADRLVKMFNEGIKNFELAKVHKYNSYFQQVLKRLRGFSECPMYEESAKTQKELIELLRHKLGLGITGRPAFAG